MSGKGPCPQESLDKGILGPSQRSHKVLGELLLFPRPMRRTKTFAKVPEMAGDVHEGPGKAPACLSLDCVMLHGRPLPAFPQYISKKSQESSWPPECISLCVYVCFYECLCVPVCRCIYMWTCMHACMYVYINMNVCM